MKETINHPDHYKGNRFEAIDIIEDYELNFNLGSTLKYVLRAGKKNDAIEDLQKAEWFIKRELDRLVTQQLNEPIESEDDLTLISKLKQSQYTDRLRDADEREMW